MDRHTHTHTHIYIYIIIIIIIMSCRQHGYPRPSLATSPYHSSPPAGLQGYILCPHIVAVCKFELVVLLLHGHMWGSIGVHHLWARPCFSSSVPRVYIYIYIYIYEEIGIGTNRRDYVYALNSEYQISLNFSCWFHFQCLYLLSFVEVLVV